jgi:PAS domain S-box-containing protein
LKAQRPWLIGVSVLSLIVLALVTTFLIRSRKAGVHLNKLVNEKTGKLEETANELALQKTTLYTIIDSIPDHIFCLDVNMNFTLLNKALVEYFRLETTAIGKNISDALKFPDELKNCINAMGYKVISSGKEAAMELLVPSHDKSERVFEIVQVPFIQDSVILGVVGIAHDITALKEMREAALAASRSKSTFLANMSHEIRTPMNAILGITEIQLQNATVEGGVKEALERIYTSGDMLLGIINDILDLSRIESGKLELIVGEYEMASLISDAVQLNMIRIGSKPIEFDLRIDESTPLSVAGDELRVKQVLNNLLSNAFKHTKAGLVELSISAEKTVDTHDAVMMVFSVSDTGQGMTEEQVSKLFDEYSRFNVEANRKTEGAGLGMSITRNLVLLMGGEISVESESGKGSVFTVRLPQGRIGSAVLAREMAENLRLFRTSSRAQMKRSQITREPMPYGSVMVVDDVETNIYVAKGILAPYGLRIDSADSGFAAIEKIQNGQVYDIVFMDHMMPEMDGIETTKKIRGMGYEHPIIALTANAVVGQAEIFLGNGFDDFISKPIDMRLMNVVLNKFVRDRHPPEVVEAARRQQDAAHEAIADEGPQASLDPQLAKIFIRDASMSIAVVEALCRKQDAYRDEDIRAYVVNIHGIKSALANIGDMKLAALASKLEQAGRDRDTAVMSSETPALLNALREIIERIAPKEENAADESTDEDRSYLREKLLALQAACTMYDKKVAKDVLSELEHKAWSHPTKELLDTLARELLHSKFKRIASAVDKALHDA